MLTPNRHGKPVEPYTPIRHPELPTLVILSSSKDEPLPKTSHSETSTSSVQAWLGVTKFLPVSQKQFVSDRDDYSERKPMEDWLSPYC